MLVLGIVAFHLLAVGYASVLAGTAAEAGALALAAGRDARESAREALPEASRDDLRVLVSRTSVEVRLAPPTFLDALSRQLEVRATAAVAG